MWQAFKAFDTPVNTYKFPALKSAPTTSYEDMFDANVEYVCEDADGNRIPKYDLQYVENTFDWYKETHYQIEGIWFRGSERGNVSINTGSQKYGGGKDTRSRSIQHVS